MTAFFMIEFMEAEPCGASWLDAYSIRTVVRSQGMPAMTIAKLAQTGGVGVETVRYYQRRGLLDEPEKSGAIRRYGEEDIRRLRFIRTAQAAGFTLEEIGELLALDATEDRARARVMAERRIAAIDAKITELTAARDALHRLAKRCSSGSPGPCPILTAFEQPGG
jgi:MerR family transcriptional regulator, mercuric resistance operon regulatory protein